MADPDLKDQVNPDAEPASIDEQLDDLLADIETSIDDLDPLGELERAAADALKMSDAGDPMDGLVEFELPAHAQEQEQAAAEDAAASTPVADSGEASMHSVDVEVDLDGIDDLLSEAADALGEDADQDSPKDLSDLVDAVTDAPAESGTDPQESPSEEAELEAALRNQVEAESGGSQEQSVESDDEAALEEALLNQVTSVSDTLSGAVAEDEEDLEAALRTQIEEESQVQPDESDMSVGSQDEPESALTDDESELESALLSQVQDSVQATQNNKDDQQAETVAAEQALLDQVNAVASEASQDAAAATDADSGMLGDSAPEESVEDLESNFLSKIQSAVGRAEQEFDSERDAGTLNEQPDIEALLEEATRAAEAGDDEDLDDEMLGAALLNRLEEVGEVDSAEPATIKQSESSAEGDPKQAEPAKIDKLEAAEPGGAESIVEQVIDEHGTVSEDLSADAEDESGTDSTEQKPADSPEQEEDSPGATDDAEATPNPKTKAAPAKPAITTRVLTGVAFPLRFIPESQRPMLNYFVYATAANACLVWALTLLTR